MHAAFAVGPVRFTNQWAIVLKEAAFGGATDGIIGYSLFGHIDSASSEAVELLTRESNRFSLPAALTPKYLGRGLSGDIYGQPATIARLRLGSHELTGVPAAVVPAATRSRQEGGDAVLANGVLRRFNVIFDYAHGRLHVKPNSHFREPFPAAR